LALISTTPTLAEMVPVENIAAWELVKDADPIFGDLGYRLNLPATTPAGAATLSLLCTFEETGTVSYSVQFTSPAVNFGTASVLGKFNSLLRFDDGEIREAEWLLPSGASYVAFSSGGSNFTADMNNPRFEEAVRQGRAGKGGQLGDMLAIGMVASGIQMFYWNVSVSNQLALGFGTGSNRRSMQFDLREGGAAIEKLLAACHTGAEASLPADTRSPREAAPWGTLETVNRQFKTISLDPDQCLELHPVKHRRGDPLRVVDPDNPSEVHTATAGEGDLILEGPKTGLQIYFGENASAGRFQYRTWMRAAASCAED